MSFFRQLFKTNSYQKDLNLQDNEATTINEKLLAILEALYRPVFAIEPDGKIFFFSSGSRDFTYVDQRQALGKSYLNVLALPKEEKDPHIELLETKRKISREYELDSPVRQGKIAARLTLTPLFNTHNKLIGALGEIEDISETKRLEQMKIDFVSIVSHELRTPITNIKSYLDVALKEARELTPEHREFIKRAFLSNERQLNTIEKLLDISQIEHGTVRVHSERIRIEEVISGVVAEFEEQAQSKGLALKFIYPHFKIPHVLADHDRLRDILTNLIGNAIKYTHQGEITVTVEQKERMIITNVSDTGVGIRPQAKPDLFKKFFRAERVLTEESPGAGLGLYIAKSFVELMKGKIWVESELEKGSTFSFSLPVAP